MSETRDFPIIGKQKRKTEMELNMTSELQLDATTDAPRVTADSALAFAVGMVAIGRDATFNALVGLAMARIAGALGWGLAEGEKRKTVDQVKADISTVCNAAHKQSQAYVWIALAEKTAKRIGQTLKDTCIAAGQAESADTAFSLIKAALRVEGVTDQDSLKGWLAGNKTEKPEAAKKSLGERVIAALGKVEELTVGEMDAIAEIVSAELHRRVAKQEAINRANELAQDQAAA